jgi:hypothetical protein
VVDSLFFSISPSLSLFSSLSVLIGFVLSFYFSFSFLGCECVCRICGFFLCFSVVFVCKGREFFCVGSVRLLCEFGFEWVGDGLWFLSLRFWDVM